MELLNDIMNRMPNFQNGGKPEDDDSVKEVQKVEVSAVIAVTDQKPNDFYIGQEFSNGSSMNISPQDFLPGNMSKIS